VPCAASTYSRARRLYRRYANRRSGYAAPGYLSPDVSHEAEVHQLLIAPDPNTNDGIRDRAILQLMYAAGLRVSEVVTLKQKNVDLRMEL